MVCIACMAWSACLLFTTVSPAKMTEPSGCCIIWGLEDRSNHVLDGAPIPPGREQFFFFGGEARCGLLLPLV